MAGRPTKYTPETAKKITDAIRVGATFRLACAYAGVSEDTFARWRERYADFADMLREAEGQGAVGWLAKIEKAANDGDWKAGAWKLERRYPQEYGRQVIDQQHSGGLTIRVEYVDPDPSTP
jgi:transposase